MKEWLPHVRIEPAIVHIPGGRASDPAAPGKLYLSCIYSYSMGKAPDNEEMFCQVLQQCACNFSLHDMTTEPLSVRCNCQQPLLCPWWSMGSVGSKGQKNAPHLLPFVCSLIVWALDRQGKISPIPQVPTCSGSHRKGGKHNEITCLSKYNPFYIEM